MCSKYYNITFLLNYLCRGAGGAKRHILFFRSLACKYLGQVLFPLVLLFLFLEVPGQLAEKAYRYFAVFDKASNCIPPYKVQ